VPKGLWTIEAHNKNPTLAPHESVFVDVCSFTFRFEGLPQLERAIAYYEQKILPSSIIPPKGLRVPTLPGPIASEIEASRRKAFGS